MPKADKGKRSERRDAPAPYEAAQVGPCFPHSFHWSHGDPSASDDAALWRGPAEIACADYPTIRSLELRLRLLWRMPRQRR
jgi:hypothetical protein